MSNQPEKASAKRHEIDIETTSAAERRKIITGLTWPALAENVLATLVSMADTIMVSGLGAYATSAVGLVTQPRFIMMSAFMALGIGTTAPIARARGAGDRDLANRILRQSLMLALGLCVLLCTVMLCCYQPLIRFIAGANISAEAVAAADDYFLIQIYGFPLLGLTLMMNSALRGVGNTRAAFISNTAANVVNVIFNYLLIGGKFGFPEMGVAGASLATVIGQAVAFLFCLYWLLNGKQYIRLTWEKFKVEMRILKTIINIGMPALIEQVLMRTGMMLFTLIATSLGDLMYSAHIIGMNIQSMSFTTGMAFGTAATTLTGQCLGRKNPDQARRFVRETQQLGYIVSFIVALFLFFGGGWMASWYTKDATTIKLVSTVLMIIALSNPTSNARFVYNSALRGAGDSRFTAVITFVGLLVVRPLIAVLLIYVFDFGLVGLWISLVSDALVTYILAKYRWGTGKWALIKM